MNKNNKGFTLLELIIYLFIFSIIGVLGATILNFGLVSKKTNTRTSETYQIAERALSQVVEAVHQASAISSASGSTLQLVMASSTMNPTIFTLSGGAITRKEGVGDAIAITPSTTIITSLSFTAIQNPSPSATSVQVQVVSSYNDNGSADPNVSYTLQTTALPL